MCVFIYNSYKCHYNVISYSLAACYTFNLDIDECMLNTHQCDQLCINTVGLHACSCQEDFYLAPNGRSCIPSCGGYFNQSNGTFHSPGWPQFYPEMDFQCEWTIEIPAALTRDRAMGLQFTFNDSAFGLGGQARCSSDYINFFTDVGTSERLFRKVCSDDVPSPFNISSSHVRVVFKSSSLQHLAGQVGARVFFHAVELGKQGLYVL